MARGRFSALAGSVIAASVFGATPALAQVADTTPPPAVASFTARPADQRVYLTWTYPTMPADWSEVIVRRYTGSTITPTGSEGLTLHAGRGTTFVDAAGPVNGTPVNYAIYTVDLSGNYSAAATLVGVTPVPAAATSLTASSSLARVAYGQSTVLHAELLRADDGRPIADEIVEFYARAGATAAWGLVGRVKTAVDGTADVSFSPRANSDFQVLHKANVFYGATESNMPITLVAPALTAKFASVFVGTDQPIVVVGAVHPPHAGQAIYLQRRGKGGVWQSVASSRMRDDGSYRLTVVNASTGEFDYRVHKPADSDHLSVTSAITHITVSPRTLRPGMSGRDVLALQQQLAALKYDVGAINGIFGYDTLHALVPFQKVNGLKRTGVVDGPTRARLGRPIPAALREKKSGNQIEIDLTKQVLIAGTNGVVTRVLDISSGGGYFYMDEGVRYKADTPEGRFRIQRKINGIRVSRLGELYRPAYFYGGFAIHGSQSVPTSPQSHGCIRVTNPAQNRQYDLLTIGTSVWIFRS
ncbi:MAG: L,D-transpeptidase family protein [Mycobacteriales bacterium]